MDGSKGNEIEAALAVAAGAAVEAAGVAGAPAVGAASVIGGLPSHTANRSPVTTSPNPMASFMSRADGITTVAFASCQSSVILLMS